jgi:RND family efflux transporter MFP subunit
MNERGLGMKFLQGALALLVLFAAVAAAVWLVKTKPAPQRQKPPKVELLVETTSAARADNPIVVEAMGAVISDQEVTLNPELTGLVNWKNPQLIAGGIVEAGEDLIRIDDRNYRVALRQAESTLRRAQVEYELESARAAVAAEEWKLVGREQSGDERHRALALREPQLESAAAGLAAASNAVFRAELDLERRVIKAPFNAAVLREQVDIGQLVGPQTSIATLIGSDRFLVQAALPASHLGRMQWPDENGEGGAAVRIEYERGDAQTLGYSGRVLRVETALGESGRLARVLIAVDDPLRLASGEREQSLFIGAYVRCLIDGGVVADSFRLPSELLREGDKIWIMNDDSQLEIRPVEVAWRQGGQSIVASGIEAGERIVSSHIAVPLPGAALREAGAGGSPQAGKGGQGGRKPGAER